MLIGHPIRKLYGLAGHKREQKWLYYLQELSNGDCTADDWDILHRLPTGNILKSETNRSTVPEIMPPFYCVGDSFKMMYFDFQFWRAGDDFLTKQMCINGKNNYIKKAMVK